MRIIIIGASGTIGHRLFADAVAQGFPVLGTYFTRAMPQLTRFDITSGRLTSLAPNLSDNDCVYLLSAHTNPNWIFNNREVSANLNVHATIKVIDEIFSRNAKLVFISTELVFDGVEGGYCEFHTPNPTTLYGKQKVAVEEYIRNSPGNWCIARTGATVGYRFGDNCPVVKTYQTLLSGEAKMASNNIFSLTNVRDTSSVLLKLADRSKNGIYHVVSMPPISRSNLAKQIIEFSQYGHLMNFKTVSFEEIPYPEVRPRWSWLSNQKVVTGLGACFMSPKITVRRKVALIDQWHTHGLLK